MLCEGLKKERCEGKNAPVENAMESLSLENLKCPCHNVRSRGLQTTPIQPSISERVGVLLKNRV